MVNETLDGPLDLNPEVKKEIPADKIPPFLVAAEGKIADVGATLRNQTRFNPGDLGKTGAVFVTARVPGGSLGTVFRTPQSASSGAEGHKKLIEADANSFVLVQLTPSGWQPVVGGQLIPYASGVLGDQLAAQTILDGTDRSNLKGAEFCVGYGTSADAMIADGRIRAIATVRSSDSATSTEPAVSCLVGQVKEGLWAINAENRGAPGRGFQVEKRNGVMIFTYYGYGRDGDGLWALSAGAMTSSTYTGSMDLFQGGTPIGGAYRAAGAAGNAGTVRMDFTSPTQGSITFPGEAATSITKFDFGGSTAPTVIPENGLWVIDSENTGQPGRGFQFEQHDGTLIMTYYGYGQDGVGRWALSAGTLNGNSYTGSLDRFRGGTVLGQAYAPASVSGSEGTVAVLFSSSTKGTITFPGEAPKAISKFSF